ncbi:MAG: dihydroorotase family protein [Candidatus Marinimicrobia bacterium]|nr:dihydroorotase family protein [Candidatus Neomarinimicrobiota bacterium]MDD5582134.1 dihydroorotase family protein [Candidatus Neomarinimicrobiota bacterium]
MHQKILLKNGTLLYPHGAMKKEDLMIENGKIREIDNSLSVYSGIHEIDVTGGLLLPGMIDPHVHFREPGFLEKEGIDNGSKAAIKGGVTTVFDMPNTNPPCDNLQAFEEKRSLFQEKSFVNWGLHYMASPTMGMLPEKALSAKIYMARSSSQSAWNDFNSLKTIFQKSPCVTIHGEDEKYFIHNPCHSHRRPRKAIQEALKTIKDVLINLSEDERPRVILCHASTVDDVSWLKEMKAKGFDVWGETAPHYLWFTADDEEKYGAKYQVNPPLRNSQDREALRQAVKEGILDFIGTDHAPHTPAEKASSNPPSGIPGIEWAMPAILELAEQQIIPWSRIIPLIYSKSCQCYKLSGYSGLNSGGWANVVVLKKTKKFSDTLVTKAGYNPYEHLRLTYSVDKVFVNGNLVYDEGQFKNLEKGKEIVRAFSD